MQDDRSSGWNAPRDVAGLFDTFQRVVTQQNEAWMRVLRKATAGGYTPSEWVADLSDMAQKWYVEVQEHLPRPGMPVAAGSAAGAYSAPGEGNLPSLQFEIDSQAEGADARPMSLPQRTGGALHATPLRSLDDAPAPQGARVTILANAGDTRVRVGLAGLRRLEPGRYISAIEDESGRVLGVVFVKRG